MTFENAKQARWNTLKKELDKQTEKHNADLQDPSKLFDIISDSRSPAEKLRDDLLNKH